MHSQGICHRDLKPENLLLDHSGNIKVSDLGLATKFLLSKTGRRKLKTFCGSPPYVAPELIHGNYEAEPVDLWSSGIILFVLMTGSEWSLLSLSVAG